jgi:hypothetical protein
MKKNYKLHKFLSSKGNICFSLTGNKKDELLLIETIMNYGGHYIGFEEVGELVYDLYFHYMHRKSKEL